MSPEEQREGLVRKEVAQPYDIIANDSVLIFELMPAHMLVKERH